jgi:hypothetical protein
LAGKVALRRWLLDRHGLTDNVHVLDVCSGYGMIWSAMEKHCTIKRWVRCDIKPLPDQMQSSMLRLSAVQSIGSMPLHEFTVVDIDTYGEPYEAFFLLLQRLKTPMAVFLTHGRPVKGAETTNFAKSLVGLPADWPIPQLPHVVDYISARCLERMWDYVDLLDAGQIYSHPGQARHAISYYAFFVQPKGWLDPNRPPRAIDLD